MTDKFNFIKYKTNLYKMLLKFIKLILLLILGDNYIEILNPKISLKNSNERKFCETYSFSNQNYSELKIIYRFHRRIQNPARPLRWSVF